MSYWGYIIDYKYNNIIDKITDNNVLTYYKNEGVNINIGDTVIIFLNNGKNGKYVKGTCIISSNISKNVDNIEIHRDCHLNNFIIPIKKLNILKNPLKLSNIKSLDKKTKNNINAKFKKNGLLIKLSMPHIGEQILEYIDNSKKYDNEKQVEEVTDEHIHEEYDDIDTDDDNDNDLIPIMIVPCKKFILPKKDIISNIINHLLHCKQCDITNNNPIDLSRILKTISKFKIIKNAFDIDDIIECYQTCQIYVTGKNTLLYIDDRSFIYDQCFIVLASFNLYE